MTEQNRIKLERLNKRMNEQDSRVKKMDEILAKDARLKENVEIMVASGFDKYQSFRECYLLMNEQKIYQRTIELMKQGIPRYQARCVAESELFV